MSEAPVSSSGIAEWFVLPTYMERLRYEWPIAHGCMVRGLGLAAVDKGREGPRLDRETSFMQAKDRDGRVRAGIDWEHSVRPTHTPTG